MSFRELQECLKVSQDVRAKETEAEAAESAGEPEAGTESLRRRQR